VVSVNRSIVMKLIYKDKYDEVDENMSDSNVGARKGKNIRNHIFVVNGIVHDALHNRKSKPNKNNQVAISTPVGLTERTLIPHIVMQGDVFGPLQCSVQVDTFGKECLEEQKYLYPYKGLVGVPPLGMVDDILCVSECGINSVILNSYIRAKTNIIKLQY
jgi:hypothetical protein